MWTPALGRLWKEKMENRPYQRKGVSSNTQAGKDFENKILFKKNNGTFLNRYIYSASQAC